jgi:hypothetical protein
MRLALALSCLLAGCMSYADLPPDDPRRLSVPERHDRDVARRRAEQQAEAERAAQWRRDHPEQAARADADARARRPIHCSSSTHLGQTWTNCY